MATVVNNIGTNYVLYYNIINYFKTIMKNHPSIQRVSYGDNFMLDGDEFPQYPLGNVIITNEIFGSRLVVNGVGTQINIISADFKSS